MLRYNRQRQVVAVAAVVVDLVSVAVACECPTVREVTERADNWIRRDVVYHGENYAMSEHTVANITKGKLCVAVNHHAVGDNTVGVACIAVQLKVVSCVGVEGQGAHDDERTASVRALAR